MKAILAASTVLLLGACANTGMDSPTYAEEYRQLTAECHALDGVLVPIGSGTTGDPSTDYACSRQDRLLQ